jgi:hypothetical protein
VALAVALAIISFGDAANVFFNTPWMLAVAFVPVIVGFAAIGLITLSTAALGRLSFVPLAQAAILQGVLLTMSVSNPGPMETTFNVFFRAQLGCSGLRPLERPARGARPGAAGTLGESRTPKPPHGGLQR